MRQLWFVVLCGCGFTPGAYVDARAGDAAADVTADAPANCYAQWLDGTIRFDTPVPLVEVNAPQVYDRDPYLTADERTIYVSSGRTGGMGGTVWAATRANRTAPFSMPVVAQSFESVGNETKLSFSADNLYAVVGSDRDTPNSIDVWEASRQTVGDPWPALERDHLAAVNTPGADHDPTISADGLRLYLSPNDGVNPQVISVAVRSDRTSDFSAPAEITELSSGDGDADPSPTPDERIMLFSSGRAAAVAGVNVWYATRANANAAFSPPAIVPDINTDAPEGDPHLSSDGCRIYFGRNVDTQSYDWDIFVATALP